MDFKVQQIVGNESRTEVCIKCLHNVYWGLNAQGVKEDEVRNQDDVGHKRDLTTW